MAAFIAAVALAVASPTAGCEKTYTGPMVTRAINAAYSGTRSVSRADRVHLERFIRCARPGVSRARMRARMQAARKAWWRRCHPPMYTQLASWYYDGGQTASGFHAGYGVANKWLRFGTRVLFRYHGRSVWATVDDRGPYVGGRAWDLNQATAGALGFGGVDWVQASVSG